MKTKKKIIAIFVVMTVSISSAFGFIGFGLYGLQDMVTVEGHQSDQVEGVVMVLMDRQGFENPYGLGGYIYLDFIPFIDIEADVQATFSKYTFNFQNYANSVLLVETGEVDFAYARISGFLTVRRKLIGLSLPVLGGVKLHAGGGLNFHKSVPFASINMMEDLLGDDLFNAFEASSMEDKIVDYIKENAETNTGFHAQIGVQLKLLVLDSFIYYRYVISKDLYPDTNGFGTLNLRIGLGF
ncbi:MAG: hypothetical protein ISS29_08360 [Candidatus Marinimicrobia bacterium]|nr:hypothetical protein [Candidatus Neomarinimicrobiota bacterium]